MALSEGTNCGFVTDAPTSDPGETNLGADNVERAAKFTAPAGATAITEIGWWCDNSTEAANFQVGIYDHDATNNKPNNLLASSGDVAKGTTSGWKKATVNQAITAGTVYWLAFQLDDTATGTSGNYSALTGGRRTGKVGATSLTNPWGDWESGYSADNSTIAVYAKYITSSGLTIELADQVSVSDIMSSAIGKSLADSASISDAISKAIAIRKSDSISAVDAIKKSPAIAKGDSINISDSCSKFLTISKSDSVTISDSCKKSAVKNLSDHIIVSDIFNRTVTWIRVLADIVNISDRISKTHRAIKNLTNTIERRTSVIARNFITKRNQITLNNKITRRNNIRQR